MEILRSAKAKMKEKSSIAIFLLFLLFSNLGFAEEKVPEGMEIIEVGKARHVVPIGTKVSKKHGLIFLESKSEYMARHFLFYSQAFKDFQERVAKIEEEVKGIKEAIQRLEELVKKVQLQSQQEDK